MYIYIYIHTYKYTHLYGNVRMPAYPFSWCRSTAVCRRQFPFEACLPGTPNLPTKNLPDIYIYLYI